VVSPTERVKAWREDRSHIRFNHPRSQRTLAGHVGSGAVPLATQRRTTTAHGRLRGEGGKAFIAGADISQFEDMRAQKEAVKRYEQSPRPRFRASTNSRSPPSPASEATASRRRERGHQLRPARRFCGLGLSIPATRLGSVSLLRDRTSCSSWVRLREGHFFTVQARASERCASSRQPRRGSRAIGRAARRIYERITTGAPLTIKAGKRIIQKCEGECDFDAETCSGSSRLLESEDYVEGRKAFMEKRKPCSRASTKRDIRIMIARSCSADVGARRVAGEAHQVLIGYTPGGRPIRGAAAGPKLGEKLGQPIVIENKPGSAGDFAAELMLQAPAEWLTR